MLLALDPATRTGWALCEPWNNARPRIRVGSWQLPEKQPIQEKVEHLAAHLVKLCGEEKIEYAAIEIPQSGLHEKEQAVETPLGLERQRKVQGNIKTQNQLWCLHGASVAIISALGIPYRGVGVSEWRKHTHGTARISGPDSKRKCAALLSKLDVHCPNQDAAEAAGVLFYLNGFFRRWKEEDALNARIAA